MQNLKLLFSKKFKQASFIYLTIDDEVELRKQLKDVFSDIWNEEYLYDYAIQNIDENYLKSKIDKRIQSLFKDYSNHIEKFYIVLDFIVLVISKIHSANGSYDFDDNLSNSSALEILAPTERYKFEKIINTVEYAPLLKALDLPYITESGTFVNDTNYEFTRDLLNMIDQSPIHRLQSKP